MSHTSCRAGARARSGRTKLAASFIAAGVIAGGLLIAPANPASSAQAALGSHAATAVTVTKKTSTSVKVSNKTFQRGARSAAAPLLKITVRAKGSAVSGKVKVNVAGKTKTATIKKGRAQVRLTSKMRLGKNRVSIKFLPRTGVKLKTSRTSTTVTAKRYPSRVLEVAARYIGTPYRYGGSSPRGFDCSGFTSYVYRKAGVKKLSHSAAAQRRVGKAVSRSKARPGDLIYTPGHIAIYAGGNKMIDAPRPGQRVGFRKMWQRNPVFVRVSSKAVSL